MVFRGHVKDLENLQGFERYKRRLSTQERFCTACTLRSLVNKSKGIQRDEKLENIDTVGQWQKECPRESQNNETTQEIFMTGDGE